MKKILVLSILGLLAVGSGCSSNVQEVNALEVSGCNAVTALPTTINLNDCSESVIRNYYSSLNSLSNEERQGNNLLKNLKPILYNMNYFNYDTVWKIYEITDRDWSLSPAKDIEYGTYNSSNNTFENYQYGTKASDAKNNPYLRDLYKNRENGSTIEAGRIKAWENHGKTSGGTDREHIWCQSRGFKADSGAKGPAGTDIHHLQAGDSRVNQSLHNNNPYGYVDKTKDYDEGTKYLTYIASNLKGSPLHPSTDDEATVVFEPQDCDKGDIARACFYMAARYNNLSGSDTISQYEPNLVLVNHATANGDREDSSSSKAVGMGILQDLLEWNKLDPVDDYEIHRNNLIFNNYQGNRNPFIDFPEWADYIWGKSENGVYNSAVTGSANPSSDAIAKPSKGTAPSSDTTPTEDNSKQPLDWKKILIIAGIGIAVLVVLIIIFASLSKRNKKKVTKKIKKVAKKEIKSQSKKKK